MPEKTHTSSDFPSIGQLFTSIWQTYAHSFLRLLLLSVFVLVPVYVIAFLLGLVGVGGVSAAFMQNNSVLSVGSIGLLIVIGFIYIVICVIVGYFLQAANIRVIDTAQSKPDFKALLKGSLPFIWPLFLYSIVGGFIISGASFLFIIPGILLTFFFLFAPFELVLEKRGVLNSMRRSLAMTTEHFGPLFLRLLLLVGLLIAAYIVLYILLFIIIIPLGIFSAVTGSGDQTSYISAIIQVVVNVISSVIGSVIGWWVLIYIYELYKQSRERTAKDKIGGLKWPLITAIVGWILGIIFFILFIGLIIALFSSKDVQKAFQEGYNQATTTITPAKASPADSYIQAGAIKLQTANQIAQKTSVSDEERDQIIGLINGALADFRTATEKDPDNYVAWYSQGEAYRNLMGVTPNADQFAINAYKQSIAVNPNDEAVYLALGGVYYQMKDYNSAIVQFQKVVELNPDSANGFYNLGSAYKKAGANASAKKAFQQALSLMDDDDPDRYKVEQELQGL